MHLDRPADLIPLADCADLPAEAVGRKSTVLAWAERQGMATPGGFVLPSSRFWAVLGACGAAQQARYLERNALRLDPRHVERLAGAIREAMLSRVVDEMALADAQPAFARLGAPTVVCRSSAAMEDGRAAAFPGVFVSVLHLTTEAALGAAIARCWRSAFSAQAIAYMLRLRAEPIQVSLAVLMQRQLSAAWYGIYASVDPATGARSPLVELSNAAPDALVSGAAAKLTARSAGDRWAGLPAGSDLPSRLDAVRRCAWRFAEHLETEVELEFALPLEGPPAILQCRPLTRFANGAVSPVHRNGPALMIGRPCAPGRLVALAVDPAATPATIPSPRIAVTRQVTTEDYAVLFAHDGVVTEADASPLSHVAILCRELGIPFVSGVRKARPRLVGHRVSLDGDAGHVSVSAGDPAAARPRSGLEATADASLGTMELLLRVLAEADGGRPFEAEAELTLHRYARTFGHARTRLTASAADETARPELDALGARLFGPGFSVTDALGRLNARISE